MGEALSTPAKTFTGPAQVPGSASITSVIAQGSGGNGSLEVTWVAPISLNGAVLTGYKVNAVDTTNGSQPAPTGCSVGPDVLNCTLTGVKVADAYTVTVEVDTQDQSDPLNPIDLDAVKTTQPVPGAPTSIAVTAQTSGLLVSWNNVGPADRYVIKATDGVSGITTTANSGAKSTNLLVESPSHPFEVTVQAIVGNATGITSPAALVPAAPESLVATVGAVVGSGKLKVIWSDSTTLPSPDSYLVTIKPSDAGISPSNCSVTYLSSNECTFTGLTNGIKYTVQVASKIGSLTNAVTTSATPYDAPNQITKPSIAVFPSAVGGQLTVTWTAPANNGSTITQYDIKTSPLSSTTTFTGSCAVQCSATVSGLVRSRSYTVSITATNGPGSVSNPSVASNSATPYSYPGKVTVPKVTVQSDGTMSVDWCAPVNDVGNPWGASVSKYEIQTNSVQMGTQPFLVDSHVTPILVDGCADSYHYEFANKVSIVSPPSVTIYARNGKDSASSEIVNPRGAPRNGLITPGAAAGSGSLNVAWSAPGAGMYTYTAKAFLGAKKKGSCQPTGALTSCTITGLTNGSTYSVQVTADSTAESSTAAFGTAIPYTRPDAAVLSGLTRDTVDNDITFNVSWTDGESIGGRPLEGYTCTLKSITTVSGSPVEKVVAGQDPITEIPLASPQCSFENANAIKAIRDSDCVADITFGCRYKIEVKTFNGPGSFSTVTSYEVTPPTEPNAPTITSITDGNGSADLNFKWSQVDTGGMPIILFSVYAVDSTNAKCISDFDTEGSSAPACNVYPCVTLPSTLTAVNGGATSCHVANLNNGMSYRFVIRAKNSVGWSTWSAWSADIAQPVGGPTGGIVKISAASKTVVVSVGTDPDVAQFSVNNADLLPGFRLTISTSCIRAISSPGANDTSACVSPNNPAENCTASLNAPGPSANQATIAAWRSFLASPTCEIKNLQDGTQYTYVVTVSDTWTSAPGSLAAKVFEPVTATPNGPPGTPTNLNVTTGPDNTLEVSFGPANANGGTITGYQVQVTTSTPDLPGTFGCNGGPVTPDNTGMTCEVVGLVPGLAYSVQVFAVGTNGSSGAASTVYTLGVASPPTNVVAQSVNRQVLISWDSGSLDGFPITSYVARIANTGRTCTTRGDRTKLISGDPSAIAPGLSCAIPVSCAVNNSPCAFNVQVAAVTSVTNPLTNVVTDVYSAYASAEQAILVVAPPSAPRNVVVYDQPNALIVRWSPPSSIGLGVTFYRVQATASGVSPSPACVSVAKPGGGTCALQIKKAGAYSVSVTPYDTAGPGTPFTETASTGTAPWAPQNLQAYPDDSGVTLSWSPGSTSLTGFTTPTVTGYQCSIVGSNLAPAASGSTSCSFTGLDPNKTYVLTVASYQSASAAKVLCIDAPTISMKPIKFSTLGTPTSWDGGKFAAPSGAAYSPDGQVLFTIDAGVTTKSGTGIIKVTKAGKTTLLVLPQGTSFTKLKGIAVRTNGPSWQILVADAGTGSIHSLYVDPATPDFVTQASLVSTDFNAPSAIALSSDTASLFVADPQGAKLSVIDLTDNSVTPIAVTGKLLAPASISLSADGKSLYLVDTGTKTVDVLPVAGGQIQALSIEPSPALTCTNCSFKPIAITSINSGYLVVGDERGRLFMLNSGGGMKAITFAGVVLKGVGGLAYSSTTSKLVATTLNGAVVTSVS